MEEIEESALASFDTPPRFWKRYVNDTCTALPADSASSFHDHLNSVNEHIQFTVEKEKDGVLPFLDGTIETSVYRKQMHTDRYLDFLSHHPLSHKKSVVKSLLSRAKALSSTAAECTKEKLHVNCHPSLHPRLIRTYQKNPGTAKSDCKIQTRNHFTEAPRSFEGPRSTNLSEWRHLQDPLQGLQPCLYRSVRSFTKL